jgi:hypothetical protein
LAPRLATLHRQAEGPVAPAESTLRSPPSPLEGVYPLVSSAGVNPRGEAAERRELEPLALALADPLAGLVPAIEPRAVAVNGVAAPSVEPAWESALVAEVVQRVAWGGDRRRGVAHLELGGALAGTRITIEGEGREVRVDIALGAGGVLADLPERLAARLARRGITLRSLDVR